MHTTHTIRAAQARAAYARHAARVHQATIEGVRLVSRALGLALVAAVAVLACSFLL